MWTLLMLACGAPEPEVVEPAPPVAEPEPSVDDLVWVSERDAAGRFEMAWPAEPGGAEASSSEPEEEEEEEALRWFITTAAAEAPVVKASVGWALVDRGERTDEALLALGLRSVDGPEDAEAITLGGLPARLWRSSNWSTQFTSAVALGADRLYVVRAVQVSKERDDALHDRIMSAFRPLGADALSDEEQGATDTFVRMVAATEAAAADRAAALAEAEAAKQAAIAAGERPTDELLVQQHVLEQSLGMYCVNTGSPAVTLRLSVAAGKITSARVFEVPVSFSNNPPPPRERADLLADCVLRYARGWRFPEDVSASGVEVPLLFTPM